MKRPHISDWWTLGRNLMKVKASLVCHKAACVRASQRQVQAIGHETHRFTVRPVSEALAFRGPGAKEFPILEFRGVENN